MTSSHPLSHDDRDVCMTYKEFRGKMKHSFLYRGLLVAIQNFSTSLPDLFSTLHDSVQFSANNENHVQIEFFRPQKVPTIARNNVLSFRMDIMPAFALASCPQEIADDILSESNPDFLFSNLDNIFPEKSYPAVTIIPQLLKVLQAEGFVNATSIAHWPRSPGQFKFRRGEQILWVTLHNSRS